MFFYMSLYSFFYSKSKPKENMNRTLTYTHLYFMFMVSPQIKATRCFDCERGFSFIPNKNRTGLFNLYIYCTHTKCSPSVRIRKANQLSYNSSKKV